MKRSLRIVKRSVELDHLNRAVSSESSAHARQKAISPSLGLDDGSSGELSHQNFMETCLQRTARGKLGAWGASKPL